MLNNIEELINQNNPLYSNNLEPMDSKILQPVSIISNTGILNSSLANLNLYNVYGVLIYNSEYTLPISQSSDGKIYYNLNISQFISSSNINSGQYYFTYDCINYKLGAKNGFVISQISPSRNEVKIIRDLSLQNSIISKRINDITGTTLGTIPGGIDSLEYTAKNIIKSEELLTITTSSIVIPESSGSISRPFYLFEKNISISNENMLSLNPITGFEANMQYNVLDLNFNFNFSGSLQRKFTSALTPRVELSILVNNKIIANSSTNEGLTAYADVTTGILNTSIKTNYTLSNIKPGDVISFAISTINSSGNSIIYLLKDSTLNFKSEINENDTILGYEYFLTRNINNRAYYKNIFLKVDSDKFARIINISEDSSKNVYTLKLYEALPTDIDEKTIVSIVEKYFSYGDSISYDIINESLSNFNILRPANYNSYNEIATNSGTTYKTWNSLLDTNLSSVQKIASSYINSYNSARINVDYTDFDNFILYSSAETRVNVFFDKIRNIEFYNEKLEVLHNVTSSIATSNILNYITARADIISNFDGFEQYLFTGIDSGSLYTFISGSILPWPKNNTGSLNWLESYNYLTDNILQDSNSTTSYTLKSSNSVEVIEYLQNLNIQAKTYDLKNVNRLVNILPRYINNDANSSEFIKFVNMIGHYYDNLRLYVKGLSDINSHEEHIYDGVSNDLLADLLESRGWKLASSKRTSELWQYGNGTNNIGEPIQSGSLPSISYEQYNHEIWKRIYNNLPFIYKTKGTLTSVRALMNCYGIPSSMLNIKEYGGPSVHDIKPFFGVNKYLYSLNFSSSAASTASIAWSQINPYPTSIQFQFKPDTDVILYPRTLFELDNNSIYLTYDRESSISKYGTLNLYLRSSGSSYLTSSLSNIPMFNELYTSVNISLNTSSYESNLNVIVNNEDDIIYNNSSSVILNSLQYINSIQLERGLTYISESLAGVHNVDIEFIYQAISSTSQKGLLSTSNLFTGPIATLDISGSIIADAISYTYYVQDIITSTWYYLDLSTPNRLTINLNLYAGNLEMALNALGFTNYNNIPSEEFIYPKLNFGTTNNGIANKPFIGQLREFRYWKNILDNESCKLYSLNPLSYSGLSISSSYDNLIARIPFTYKTNISGSPYIYSSIHPNQSISTFINGEQIGMELYNFNNTSLIGTDTIIYEKYPSLGSNNLYSNKIRIIDNDIDSPLNLNKSVENISSSKYPTDSPNLGIFLSPQDMVDSDISNQLGDIQLDNYIGDPNNENLTIYPDLERLKNEYWKKYSNKNNIPATLKVLSVYDFSFFEQVKQLLPGRVNPMTGIMIKPNILERNKIVLHDNDVSFTKNSFDANISCISRSISGTYDVYHANLELSTSRPSIYIRTITEYISGSGWINLTNGYTEYEVIQPVVLSNRLSNTRYVREYIYSTLESASMNLPSSSYYKLAEIQDYSLDSSTYKTSRYTGTRTTAPGFNSPCPDLPNNEPLIQITIVGSTSTRNIDPILPPVKPIIPIIITNPQSEDRNIKVDVTPAILPPISKSTLPSNIVTTPSTTPKSSPVINETLSASTIAPKKSLSIIDRIFNRKN